MTVYLVTGERPYRGHLTGHTFEADLEPAAAARAIRRGAIQVLNDTQTRIQPGSYTPPDGWPKQQQEEE